METDEVSATRFCGKCGLRNTPGNRFCGNCGSALGAEAAAPVDDSPAEGQIVAPSVPRVDPSTLTLPLPPSSSIDIAAPVSADAPTFRPPAPPLARPPETALSGIARERERDRLLTLANVQRMRDQSAEARKTLEQALTLMEGMPGHQIAPIYELIGDLYDGEAHWDEARKAYNTAHELDPGRVSAERKFAALTLRVAEVMPGNSLAEAVLRGDSIADLLSTGALAADRGRRNAGVAMLLSSAIPGFGQFYNGEFVKGAVILATYATTLLYFAFSADREIFVHKFAAILALSKSHAANASVSALSVIAGVLMVAVWLYAIVDAPFMAAKRPASDGSGRPFIDKSGWEV